MGYRNGNLLICCTGVAWALSAVFALAATVALMALALHAVIFFFVGLALVGVGSAGLVDAIALSPAAATADVVCGAVLLLYAFLFCFCYRTRTVTVTKTPAAAETGDAPTQVNTIES